MSDFIFIIIPFVLIVLAFNNVMFLIQARKENKRAKDWETLANKWKGLCEETAKSRDSNLEGWNKALDSLESLMKTIKR